MELCDLFPNEKLLSTSTDIQKRVEMVILQHKVRNFTSPDSKYIAPYC